MRARLDRLLRWRESQERWESYTQMPPILILATTARQAEWWHEAAERVTQDLEIKRPLGAVVVLPRDTVAPVSPWYATWKYLGSERLCHLQEVLFPQDDPGFPDLFPQGVCSEAQEGEADTVHTTLPRPGRRLYQFATRTRKQCEKPVSPGEWRWHALDRSARQWEVLALVLAHPLLSRADLSAQLHLAESSVRHLLAPLTQVGLIVGYATRVGERFALAEAGPRLVAAAARCHVRYLIHRPGEAATDTLVPRGLPGLLKQAEHVAGVYSFCALLARAGVLHWWETGALCARVYRYQGDWHGIRPDLVAECLMEGVVHEPGEQGEHARAARFLLEWDRGTMQPRDLRRKFSSYALWYTSREWAREHRAPPALLVVAPDIGQEQRLMRIALVAFRTCPVYVTLYTTTRGLLATAGVVASIWRPLAPRDAGESPENAAVPVARLALFATPGTSRSERAEQS